MSPQKLMRFHLPTINFHRTFASFLGGFTQSGNPGMRGDAYPNLSITRWMGESTIIRWQDIKSEIFRAPKYRAL